LTLSETTPPTVRPSRRQELLAAIAKEGARLVRLAGEQDDARIRLAALRSELASLGSELPIRGDSCRIPPNRLRRRQPRRSACSGLSSAVVKTSSPRVS